MNYYTAPMEGLTDRIWRQAHQRWFGAPGAPARYYAPFISPPENRVLIKKKMAELDPAANPGAPVIPQLLAKDGALAAWMIGELRKMGYTEVNLNFGCPSGTVTAKGKGAGMLRDLSKLEAFLDEVFSQAEGPISVKTRLGVTSPEEFEAILDLYDRCPICPIQKQRVFCLWQNTRCFYFTSRPERYRRVRSKAWEADTWRTRSRPRPCWIFRTQVPSGAARAR